MVDAGPYSDREKLASELDGLRRPSPQRFRARSREVIRHALGIAVPNVWAPWLELAACEYLFVGCASCSLSTLIGQVLSACAQASGNPPPASATTFPGSLPHPYWAHWPSANQPPPLRRSDTSVPVASPRQPAWLRPDYDTPPWEIAYQLAIHMTHIGDLDLMNLFPIPGVDPVIRHEPMFALDHAVATEIRPPMGLAVALLLTRQIAYDYAAEHSRHDIARWIFAFLTGCQRPLDARTPAWVTSALASELDALQPDAMLAFCERAFVDLDASCAA